MELSNFKLADEKAEMVVLDPVTNAPLINDNGNDIYIVLYGIDSEVYRKKTREAQNRRLSQAGRAGKIKMTAEQLENEALDLLVACTHSMPGIEWEGEPVKTPQQIKIVYKNLPWLREQVDEFIGDRSDFLSRQRRS